MMYAKFLILGLVLFSTACSTVPPTSVHQPMTARPVDRVKVAPADGAIFHAGINDRPLFEDKRARLVGDILTITLAEKTTASRANSSNSSSSREIDANMPTVTTNIPERLISTLPVIGTPVANLLSRLFSLNASVTGESSNNRSSKNAGSANESLSGTITVTVIEVLPNGNLLVSGEKRVAVNNNDEFIRFSGVVDPTSINSKNTVESNRVADARIEYKNAGEMNELKNDVMTLGMLGRFFLSVLPL